MNDNNLVSILIESVPRDRINGARQAIPLLIKWMNHYKISNPNHIGYIIGTVSHESAFLPRREIRANPVTQPSLYKLQERYWKTGYYGRGYIQITWESNYRKLGNRIGLGDKLVINPDLALEPDIAAHIAVVGMHEGLFTGYKLSHFDLPNYGYNFVNARKIVNGLDRAELIASYGRYYSNVVKTWQINQR